MMASRRPPPTSPSRGRAKSKSPARGRATSKSPARGRAKSKSPVRGRAKSKSPARTKTPSKPQSPARTKTPSKSKSPARVKTPSKPPKERVSKSPSSEEAVQDATEEANGGTTWVIRTRIQHARDHPPTYGRPSHSLPFRCLPQARGHHHHPCSSRSQRLSRFTFRRLGTELSDGGFGDFSASVMASLLSLCFVATTVAYALLVAVCAALWLNSDGYTTVCDRGSV